jgi:putative membrane protein insertion efficiency factor
MPKRPTKFEAPSSRIPYAPDGWIRRSATAALLGVLRAYQLIVRPVLPPSCRFVPSCSEFARDAVRLHGPSIGMGLTLRRLGRCHPLHAGGYDPVPVPEGD